jgi:hypothetical protein
MFGVEGDGGVGGDGMPEDGIKGGDDTGSDGAVV